MSRQLSSECADELLNALEDLELPLLSWGVTSGTLAHNEVLETIDRFLMAHPDECDGAETEDVLGSLLRAALLFRIPRSSRPRRYRSRLAETLRLTTRLRQLFGPPDPRNPPVRW